MGEALFPDPSIDFQAAQDKLARRRKLAEQLVQQGMNAPNGQMVGNIYVPANPWGNFAQSFAGSLMASQADKEAQDLARQQRAHDDAVLSSIPAEGPARQQAQLKAMQNPSLREIIKAQMGIDENEAKRIEAGEQAAQTRVETAAEKEANREFLKQQKELDRQNRLDIRQTPTIHISQGGARGGVKAPVGYRYNEDGTALEPIPGGPKDPNAAPVKPVNLTAAQQKAVDDSDSLLGHIDNALEMVKTNPGAIGFKTVIPDMALSKIDPEGVAARAAVGGLSAERVHQLSGAAVSPAEFARLRPYLPASGDTADAVEKKLTNLRAEVERIKASHMKGPTRAQPQQPGKPTVVRTGILNGRKVEQLSDGTTRYAD